MLLIKPLVVALFLYFVSLIPNSFWYVSAVLFSGIKYCKVIIVLYFWCLLVPKTNAFAECFLTALIALSKCVLILFILWELIKIQYLKSGLVFLPLCSGGCWINYSLPKFVQLSPRSSHNLSRHFIAACNICVWISVGDTDKWWPRWTGEDNANVYIWETVVDNVTRAESSFSVSAQQTCHCWSR